MLKLPKKNFNSPPFIPIDLIFCIKQPLVNKEENVYFRFLIFCLFGSFLAMFWSNFRPKLKNRIFGSFRDPKWPKRAKYQNSKKQVLFLFTEGSLMQKMGSIGINGGELNLFLGNFNIRFLRFFMYSSYTLCFPPLRG